MAGWRDDDEDEQTSAAKLNWLIYDHFNCDQQFIHKN